MRHRTALNKNPFVRMRSLTAVSESGTGRAAHFRLGSEPVPHGERALCFSFRLRALLGWLQLDSSVAGVLEEAVPDKGTVSARPAGHFA